MFFFNESKVNHLKCDGADDTDFQERCAIQELFSNMFAERIIQMTDRDLILMPKNLYI